MPSTGHGGTNMAHHTKFWQRFTSLLTGWAVVGLLIGVPMASAADGGPTITGQVCMQTTFSGQTQEPIPSADRLNCTAEDIRIAEATKVSPSSCIMGETFDLTATFLVNVTANARYDAGFYFNIGGGANARLGMCSLSALTPGLAPALQLDNDFCGDLNAGQFEVTFTIPDVLCQAAPGTNVLKLPNCTAWHSNQGTACTTQTEANPDTKSKCKCDDNFTVPVIVEAATLLVAKSAVPATVSETGGQVTYTVQVTNQAQFVSVTITEITDDLYGNLGTNTPPRTDNTCPDLIGDVLAPGGTASCSFKAFVSGDSGQTITDIAEVCGTQQFTGAAVCDDDPADVTITDVPSTPTLTKTAQSAACTTDVSYQVVVSNHSAIDTLRVNALTDDKFGDITTAHAAGGGVGQVVSTTCNTALGSVIATSGNYTCSFVGRVISSSCNFTLADTVTGNVTDDDGINSTPSDGASVSVTISLQ